MILTERPGRIVRMSSPNNCGWISVIGRRREMEDAVTVAEFGGYKFFAVYDGHGGSEVSHACRERLHCLLEEEVDDRTCSVVDWETAMAVCFRKMDEEVNQTLVGSTAVVVVVVTTMPIVIVANCGHSRAVLCRDGTPLPLSRDHKPDRPDEKKRLETAAGTIITNSGLFQTSRSIGDYYLKPYVISEPEVTVSDRRESDSFIIIASDGLWDVVSNELACEIVWRYLKTISTSSNPTSEAAALLAELALARGSKDNISVVVVLLNN